jgi:hypothetical protein
MEAMIKETRPYELNLRKMAILGGVLHLDLIQQPPQPRELNKNLSLTVRELMSCTRGLSFLTIFVKSSDYNNTSLLYQEVLGI